MAASNGNFALSPRQIGYIMVSRCFMTNASCVDIRSIIEWEALFSKGVISASVLKIYTLMLCIVYERGEVVDRSGIDSNDYGAVSEIFGMGFSTGDGLALMLLMLW